MLPFGILTNELTLFTSLSDGLVKRRPLTKQKLIGLNPTRTSWLQLGEEAFDFDLVSQMPKLDTSED